MDVRKYTKRLAGQGHPRSSALVEHRMSPHALLIRRKDAKRSHEVVQDVEQPSPCAKGTLGQAKCGYSAPSVWGEDVMSRPRTMPYARVKKHDQIAHGRYRRVVDDTARVNQHREFQFPQRTLSVLLAGHVELD